MLLRDPAAATVLGALVLAALGRWIYNVALPAYVYVHTHSAAWVGALTLGRYVPALVLTTPLARFTSRVEHRWALVGADLVAMLSCAVMAALVSAGSGPVAIVIVAAVCSTATRWKAPAAMLLLVQLLDEGQLPAVASMSRAAESAAMALGPALGAGLVAGPGVTAAVAITGGTFAVSALVTAVATRRRSAPAVSYATVATPWKAVLADPATRTFAALGAQASALLGVDSVLFAVLAEQQLHGGTAGYGFLFAGLGAGGVLAPLFVARLTATARPAMTVAVALCSCSAALAVFIGLHQIALGVAVAVIRGGAGMTAETMALTAVVRRTSATHLPQAVAVYTSVVLAGLVCGAAVTPVLLHALGLEVTLAVFALAVPLLCGLLLPRLIRVDRAMTAENRAARTRVALLRRLSVFDGASRLTLERLAAAATPVEAEGGTVIMRQGDVATDFFVLVDGQLTVSDLTPDGETRQLRDLTGPDHFGEIGLLRGVHRTATVTASGAVQLLRIDGADFIGALTQDTVAASAVGESAQARLPEPDPSGTT